MTICLGIDAILWEQAKKDNPDPKKWVDNFIAKNFWWHILSFFLEISYDMFSFMTKSGEIFVT